LDRLPSGVDLTTTPRIGFVEIGSRDRKRVDEAYW
jgi:hypothetical protein